MPERAIPLLSKSRFAAGLQCHKRLYLECYEPDLATPPDEAQQARLDTGTAVGILARKLHPGGVLVTEDYLHHDAATERTKELIDRPGVPAIFEAAFTEGDVRVRVDILARTGDNSWDLIEVKSAATLKPEHIADAAIQLLTVQRSQLSIDRVLIAYINRDYVYEGGSYDPQELFVLDDVSEHTRARIIAIRSELETMKAVLGSQTLPAVDIGSHCNKPYRCEFYEFCREDEPEWSIGEIPRLYGSRWENLREAGVRSIPEIPPDVRLTELQERVREAVLSQQPYVSPQLASELSRMTPPVHFIDFEGIDPALPIYSGTTPYQVLPFQWSDHVLHPDGVVTHAEFLASGERDPRQEFTESLVAQLAGAATLVAYGSYEQIRLRELADALSEWTSAIEALLALPWINLLQLLQKHYYHHDFHGSWSLKSVLPVLVPEVSYNDLGIQEGTMASLAFLELVKQDTPIDRREKLRGNLLAYCGLDTKGMLRLIEALRGEATSTYAGGQV